jgi:hypothetical protein
LIQVIAGNACSQPIQDFVRKSIVKMKSLARLNGFSNEGLRGTVIL